MKTNRKRFGCLKLVEVAGNRDGRRTSVALNCLQDVDEDGTHGREGSKVVEVTYKDPMDERHRIVVSWDEFNRGGRKEEVHYSCDMEYEGFGSNRQL